MSSQTYDSDFLGDCCSLIAWRQDGSGSTRNPLARIQCHPAGESWRSKHGLCSLYMPGRGYETRWKPMVNCTKVLEVAGELKRSAHLAGPHLPDWARMSLIRCYFHTFLPPPLSLSLFVFFIQFNTERSLDGERISSFRSLSLSLSLWLINRDGMSVGHKSTLTRKVTITITADRLTYIQNAFMPEIWYMELSYASAYHNSIAKQILSWSRLLVLRPLLCYVFATIASRTRRFECSPETGTCKREVLWLC